jgi:hypothetical protein
MARPMDEENWIEFRHYTSVVERIRPFVIDYLALSADFSAVAGAEAEIGSALTQVFHHGMISIPVGVDANARAQQLVSNFLGAASAFRDRAASRISKDYGRLSGEAQLLKTTTSRIFDASFAYRSMYALRNFAQHHELPISFVPIDAERTPEGAMVARIALHLYPSTLAASDHVNAKVRAELSRIPQDFLKLAPLLTEFMTAHQAIMVQVLDFYAGGLTAMAQYAAAVYQAFEIPHDVVPVVWEGDDPSGGPHTQNRCIMCGFDEMLRALQLRDELNGMLATTVFHGAPNRSADPG